MRQKLLVTLADQHYIDQAKQLFASVYFNAGWDGDYMLLAYQIPPEELKWFSDKGILIKECDPILENGTHNYPPVIFSKCFMFTEEFKQWDQIVYFDADVIVRASLDGLESLKGFHAVRDANDLKAQVIDGSLGLKGHAFCAGIMVFSTDMIRSTTFQDLVALFKKYQPIAAWGDQVSFNLYFRHQWKELPAIYGFYICQEKNAYKIKLNSIETIVLHFTSTDKPWRQDHFFYAEWKSNLDRADRIDLKKPLIGKKWKKSSIIKSIMYLRYRYLIYNALDRQIGRVGIFLRKHKLIS